MIGYLSGKIKSFLSTNEIILNVGGVGYLVHCSNIDQLENSDLELFIHTHVREDQISLYGFKTEQDLKLFELLLTVKGVGPKVGMSILSYMGANLFCQSVMTEDAKQISKTPGVGKKGAERIVMELQSKIEKMGYISSGENSMKTKQSLNDDSVVDALLTLGFSRRESEEKLDRLKKSNDLSSLGVEEIIKLCLTGKA